MSRQKIIIRILCDILLTVAFVIRFDFLKVDNDTAIYFIHGCSARFADVLISTDCHLFLYHLLA